MCTAQRIDRMISELEAMRLELALEAGLVVEPPLDELQAAAECGALDEAPACCPCCGLSTPRRGVLCVSCRDGVW